MVAERLLPAEIPPVGPVIPVAPAVWPVGPRAPTEVWPAITPPRDLEGLLCAALCFGQGLHELDAHRLGSFQRRVAQGRGNRGRLRRGQHRAGNYEATRAHLQEGKKPRL